MVPSLGFVLIAILLRPVDERWADRGNISIPAHSSAASRQVLPAPTSRPPASAHARPRCDRSTARARCARPTPPVAAQEDRAVAIGAQHATGGPERGHGLRLRVPVGVAPDGDHRHLGPHRLRERPARFGGSAVVRRLEDDVRRQSCGRCREIRAHRWPGVSGENNPGVAPGHEQGERAVVRVGDRDRCGLRRRRVQDREPDTAPSGALVPAAQAPASPSPRQVAPTPTPARTAPTPPS